jgi:ABC-2 type transport system ATP-binding protein
MCAIHIEKLSKYYGQFPGIVDVSFSVNKGEVFGFIGPNGAGKSTTIRTLLGLLKPTSGKASVLGMDVVQDSTAIRKVVGYLPSEVHYYENMKVKELLTYSARFFKGQEIRNIQELADYFELDMNMRISDLSFGNKKKVGIVQSLLHKPELLILDEPTSGLDPYMQNRFFEILDEENKRGVTIFFSTHVLSEVQRICDRAAIIRKGKIAAIESVQDLLKKQLKKCNVVFKEKPAELKLPEGCVNDNWHNNKLTFDYLGDVNVLLAWLSKYDLKDASMLEPDLDTVFMNYYQH